MLWFSVSLIVLLCLGCNVSERNLCLYCSLGEFTHLAGVNSSHSCSTPIFCLKCSHLEKVQFTYQPGASSNDKICNQGTLEICRPAYLICIFVFLFSLVFLNFVLLSFSGAFFFSFPSPPLTSLDHYFFWLIATLSIRYWTWCWKYIYKTAE